MSVLDRLATAVADGRRIVLWGAGNQGRGIARVLLRHGIAVDAFVDSATRLVGTQVEGIPVHSTDLFAKEGAPDELLVIVAAFFFADAFAERLKDLGFREGVSFLPYRAVKPRDYVIEVSGRCNLHCLSCPRADRSPGRVHPRGMMSLEAFAAVLDKMLREEPFVGNVQLYQWGEPTLNPALPAMLTLARSRGVFCAVSSNLNAAADWEAIIAACPEWLRLSVSGTGEHYEVTHTGGRWSTFLTNLETVAGLRRALHPQMKVELYYHRYRHSTPDEQAEVAALCERLGVEFHPVPAYLIGLDDVLAYAEGCPLPPAASAARALLLRDLDEGLALAADEKALPCDVLDVILINADLTVSTCMMFYNPDQNTAVSNYLETPLPRIRASRTGAPLCQRCMARGVHRYCGVYARLSDQERPR